MSKCKSIIFVLLLVGLFAGCNTDKRNPVGGGLLVRDAGQAFELNGIPLSSGKSFQELVFPVVMGEQEELLVGQMNGFVLRSLLRFRVQIGELASDAGAVPEDLVVDSLQIRLDIRSSRLPGNTSIVAMQPDSPWEELQGFVDTLTSVESEFLASPILAATTQVLENYVLITLPVTLLNAVRTVEADSPEVEILLQPRGTASFLLDFFAREARAAGTGVPIPELHMVYRVNGLLERAIVEPQADTYWGARVDGGPPEGLLILSEGLFFGTMLKFDLPTAIPQGATINSAKLEFDIDLDHSYFTTFSFEIYHLEFPAGQADTIFTRYNTPLLADPAQSTYAINQSLIQAWLSGAQVNHGLALSPLNFTSTSGLPSLLNSPPFLRWIVMRDVRLNLVYSLPPEL